MVDMVYDIKHGSLVIPELDQAVHLVVSRLYLQALLEHQDWRAEDANTIRQLVCGECAQHHQASVRTESFESLVDNPVEFAWSTRTVRMERDEVQVVAEHLLGKRFVPCRG
jgi:hypothetical protein